MSKFLPKNRLMAGISRAGIRNMLAAASIFLISTTTAVSGVQKAQKLTIDIRDGYLSELFLEIEEQSDYSFVYNVAEVQAAGKHDYLFSGLDIAGVMERALAGTRLAYEIQDKHIVITRDNLSQQQDGVVSGRITDESGSPLAGVTVKIKGTNRGAVTDAAGRYTITLRGIDASKAVLAFNYVGMEAQEVAYTGQATVNVVLKSSKTRIEEVVINMGYWTTNLNELTGAATSIKADSIYNPAFQSIDMMLESHVPGMVFMQNSGTIGATPRLRVRGTSTILGNQEPIWVVDGIVQTDPVPFDPQQLNDLDYVNLLGNSISGINPEDIDQIDILKDAAATAIYGARAANGVIVITTKKGKPGPPQVSYSFSGTFSRRPHYTDNSVNMMDSRERIDYSRELMEKNQTYGSVRAWVGYEGAMKDYLDGMIDYSEFNRLVGYYEQLNTDWFDILTQNSFTHKHTLSISGGSAETRYYASVGAQDIQGVVKGEHNKTYTGNINLTTNVKNITIRFGANMSYQDRKYNPSDLGGSGIGVLNYAYGTSRAIPAYDENGEPYYYNLYNYRDDNNAMSTPFNIMNDMANSHNKSEVYKTSVTTSIDWQVYKDLKVGATLSYTYGTTLQELYYGPESYRAKILRGEGSVAIGSQAPNYMPVGGELTQANTYNKSYVIRLQSTYNKSLGAGMKHNIWATGGFEVSSNRYDQREQVYRGYVERDRSVHGLDPALEENKKYYEWYYNTALARGVQAYNLTNLVSGYLSASYSYDGRYIFNMNGRIDASNQFGSRSREKILPIWSFSGRWNIKEDILKDTPWISSLSLKASLGLQGNMLTTESSELIMQYSGKVNAESEFISYIYSYPNLDLNWEKTRSMNATVDFGFLNGRIAGSFSYYHKLTKDAFMSKKITAVNGRDYYTVNSGEIENRGIELGLSFVPIDRSSASDPYGFRWTIVPNIGQSLNQLVQRKDRTIKDEYTYQDYLDGKVQVGGKPLNSFYSYIFTGLDGNDGRPTFYGIDKDEFLPVYSEMGLENMEQIYMTVMEYSGRRVPVFQGGLTNSFSYKRVSLSFNLAFSFGSKIRLLRMYPNVDRLYGTIAPQPDKNVRREFVNRWRGPGDENYTNIPGVLSGSAFTETVSATGVWWRQSASQFPFAENIWQMYDYSNLRVVSGDYVRLQSLTLKYNIPAAIAKRMFLKSANIGFSATNLFTICSSELNGQDPTTQSGSSATINLSNRPTYSISLNLTF